MSTDESKSVESEIVEEDWFSRGKEDALVGNSKQPPETDPEQASLYDLGYGEGSIQRSLTEETTDSETSSEPSIDPD